MTEKNEAQDRPRKRQERTGVVVSAKTPKTVVVQVVRLFQHQLYRHAHLQLFDAHAGDG